MTKIYQIILAFFIAKISFGQCTNTSQNGSATASKMRKIFSLFILISILIVQNGFSQTTVTYNFTGGNQTFVVPPCVTSISLTVAGADGGGAGGGNGAVVTGTIAVTPGQILQISVGGSGSIGAGSGGFGGGGTGRGANSGANASGGGGGATSVSVSPFALANRIIVAGGGGGMGGGTTDAAGGAGGCGTGSTGVASFGGGGTGGTQSSGGTGGNPWGGGNTGSSGSLGLGAAGAIDNCNNNSPGGGGGGGYYGGGSGGADCFASAPYGGGGGGGGSSLVPAGGGCNQGTNNGPGYVTITYTATGSTVPTFTALGPYCQCAIPGILPTISTNGITGTWSPAVISTASAGTTTYTFTPNAGQCALPKTMNITVNGIVVGMPANGGTSVACPVNSNTAPIPPTVVDNCARTLTVSAPVISALPACSGTRTYTYTYTNACGTTYPWVYTYTISAPTVVMPANGSSTVACPALALAPTAPIVLDNCGRTLAVSAPVISAAVACSGTQTYTYTYTSCSGTTYPWVYTYTIGAPTVVMPANGSSTVACPALALAPTAPIVLDNCGRTLAVSAPVISAAVACSGTQTYTYTYTSCSGTSYPWVYTYTIGAPTVVMPANGSSTVACPTIAVAPTAPTVLDNCGRTLAVSAPVISAAVTCSGTQTYTYTYTSCSGTTYPWVYTYTISAPTVVMPANGSSTVACPTLVVAPTAPIVLDNCGQTLVVSAPVISAAVACSGTQTYAYTYTSCSGTTYPWVYTYTISAPTVVMPANGSSTVACPTLVVAPTAPIVLDNCGQTLVVSVPVISAAVACSGTQTYTYTYTSCAGTTYPWVYTYTINDNIFPTASNPIAISVTNGLTPIVDLAVVLNEADNCSAPTVAWVSDVSNGGNCPEIITRTFSVTDACGNQILVTQTISVGDAIMPTASNPVAVNVQCIGDVPAPNILSVTDEADNGGTPIVTWQDDISNGLTCPEIITRRYRITDNCGNFIYVTQLITVHDTQVPVFAAPPAAVSVQCATDVPAMTNLSWSDNCTGAGSVAGTDGSLVGGACGGTITRTWTYSDLCGNNATVTQTITINDTQVPVFVAPPASVSVQCATDVPAMTTLSWTDNCTGAGSVAGTDGALVGGTCGGTITRTWTYTDLCGNNATVTQIITVQDTQVPVLETPPAAVSVQCATDVPAMTTLSWTDNCTGAGSVTGTDGALVGGSCGGTITRTWTYTDLCGNIATTTQTITVDDNTLPTASNPATITVPGGPAPAVDVLVVIDEADNCSVPVVAFVSESTDGGTCPETITRIYSVTDACGNTINVTHLILITDPIFPTASNPVAVNVQCIGDVPLPNILVVTDETDNQGVPVVAFVSDVSNGLTCPETITRTYSVTDICNNVITVTQLITVHDTQVPVLATPPAAVSVQCATDVPVMTTLSWTDNCTGVGSVTGTDGALVGGACGGTITRTWTYTDLCGNVAATTQIITVHDTQVPVLATPPASVSVQCVTDVPAMTTLSWTDNCAGAGSVTGTDGALVGGACGGTITRTWTYTDLCGNIATTSQIITVHDTQVPVLATPPAALTVECIGTVPAMTTLSWTDNCTGAGSVTGTDGALVGGSCGGTITRTWTYTDLCGNIATTTQTITIDDNTLPTASNPATTIVPGGPAPAVDILVVIDEADNCSVPVVAFVSQSTDGGTCPETITRIYSVTDACGNTINVTHLILITDPIFPTASNPVAVNVQCIGDVPAPNILVVTNESDNQGVPVVAFVSDVSNGLTCPETITRTYSVTDICNNVITVTQLITVQDIISPTASNPTSINIQTLGGLLSSMAVPIDVLVVTDELDNCSVPAVAWLSDVSDGNTCPEIITRTYTVTDACGNVTNVTQIITVDDITNPTASNPIGINVQCIGDVPVPNVATVTNEADNGTFFPLVTFVSDVSDGNTCPETITRTYSVADDCGNSINVTQLITVNDITNPTASNPANISVPGSVNVPAPNIADVINEADNCTANPIVAWVSDVSDGNVCNLEEITRTYSVTDDCGNQILVTQVITILAVIPPINAGPDQLICLGDLTTLTATNALTVPISWDNGIVDGQSFSPAISTNYTVTANNLGCINSDQVTITINLPAVVSFTSDVIFGCAPLTVNFTNLTANSVSCVWTTSGGQLMNGVGTVSTIFTQPGCFDVTLTSTGINGCTTSFTAQNFICVEETPIAAFNPSSVMLPATNTQVDFDNNSIGATNYSWDFGDNSSINTDESPTYYYSSNNDSYQVMLIASTPFGCADTAYSQITVFEDLLYYVPNTFTPDEDNFNATFQPIFTSGFDPFDFTLLIFNRWGETIFESHDATIGWDGTYGKNSQIEMVQDGTYTWKIEFKTSLNDERKIIFGSVNLIR
jgi:gliding motility-associated-like protein